MREELNRLIDEANNLRIRAATEGLERGERERLHDLDLLIPHCSATTTEKGGDHATK